MYYLLEDTLNVMLVNAAHAKGLPGRKTDVSDSAWLVQLGECGLLKASFVPPEPVRHLRDLTRYRATLEVERSDAVSLRGAPRVDGATRVGNFSEQVWGVSDQRDHDILGAS